MAIMTKAAMTALADAIRNETAIEGITKEEVADLFQAIIDTMGVAGSKDTAVYIDWLYDASDGLYPHDIEGTGDSGEIAAGNIVRIWVPSAPDGNGDIKFQAKFKCIALVNNPGNNDSDWDIQQA